MHRITFPLPKEIKVIAAEGNDPFFLVEFNLFLPLYSEDDGVFDIFRRKK